MSEPVYFNKTEYFTAILNGNTPKEKPVVHFHTMIVPPLIGARAVVVPIDHPAVYLNDDVVHTSSVVAINGKNFETRNTKYVFKQD